MPVASTWKTSASLSDIAWSGLKGRDRCLERHSCHRRHLRTRAGGSTAGRNGLCKGTLLRSTDPLYRRESPGGTHLLHSSRSSRGRIACSLTGRLWWTHQLVLSGKVHSLRTTCQDKRRRSGRSSRQAGEALGLRISGRSGYRPVGLPGKPRCHRFFSSQDQGWKPRLQFQWYQNSGPALCSGTGYGPCEDTTKVSCSGAGSSRQLPAFHR